MTGWIWLVEIDVPADEFARSLAQARDTARRPDMVMVRALRPHLVVVSSSSPDLLRSLPGVVSVRPDSLEHPLPSDQT